MTMFHSLHRIAPAFILLCLLPVAAAAQQDTAEIAAVCSGCHGPDGVSQNPMVPTLAGQPYTLIEDNLLAFRAGKRSCSAQRDDGSPAALLAGTMCTIVADLTDSDISGLASYFERQAFQPAVQEFEADNAARGAALHVRLGCEGCHSNGGRTTNSMAPVLAGQWLPYLRRAMEALQSETRKGPKVMNAAIHELQDADVEALLDYYASQGKGAWDPTNHVAPTGSQHAG